MTERQRMRLDGHVVPFILVVALAGVVLLLSHQHSDLDRATARIFQKHNVSFETAGMVSQDPKMAALLTRPSLHRAFSGTIESQPVLGYATSPEGHDPILPKEVGMAYGLDHKLVYALRVANYEPGFGLVVLPPNETVVLINPKNDGVIREVVDPAPGCGYDQPLTGNCAPPVSDSQGG